MTLIEIGGLLLVIAAGTEGLLSLTERAGELTPWPAGWGPIGIGAFLAFFAFIGFENLANMAEEARAPERSLPRAILLSLGICTLLYTVIALVVVLTLRPETLAVSQTPLLDVTARAGWFSSEVFAGIAVVAVVNGVLLELIMLGRLLFGMARRGWLPAFLGTTSPERRTPASATLLGGGIVLGVTVAVPFASLVAATSTLTLLVFAGVNLALWRLQRSRPRSEGFRVPRLIRLSPRSRTCCWPQHLCSIELGPPSGREAGGDAAPGLIGEGLDHRGALRRPVEVDSEDRKPRQALVIGQDREFPEPSAPAAGRSPDRLPGSRAPAPCC